MGKGLPTIIAGSRHINSLHLVEEAVEESGFEISRVISGCARGADTFGELWAKKNGKPIDTFPANWAVRGRAAGPIRNEEMAQVGKQLIALPTKDSRGTRDMIKRAERHGLRIYVKEISDAQLQTVP